MKRGTFIRRGLVRTHVASIAVIGLGPTGLATGVALASGGHRVLGVDIDSNRIERIQNANPPFHEAGLKPALRRVIRVGRFRVANVFEPMVSEAEFVFLCVGTPSRDDGSMDDGALKTAATSVAKAAIDKRRRTLVVKSTVVPGTTETVIRPILDSSGAPFRIAVNPEFLREGKALADTLHPDRIVIGAGDSVTAKRIRALYRPAKCPVYLTTLRTAEMIKYATNGFLATKVAFANELANLCDVFGVSYDEVHRGLALDPRINPRFLIPGVGFGGSCFPKDIRALAVAGQAHGYDPSLLRAILTQNDQQFLRAVELLESELGSLRAKRIALLGLAFKGGTDDVRESRAVPIAKALKERGAVVIGYDPVATTNFHKAVPDVVIATSIEEALKDADGCIVQADWPAFAKLSAADFLKPMAAPVVVDGRRILKPNRMKGVRLRRIG